MGNDFGAMDHGSAFEYLEGGLDSGLILICDHASNAIPAAYNSLGLTAAELERHIAYDIGVASVTRQLNQIMSVPAVLSCFSRLLIDPNRGVDDPTLIMRLSDGSVVPGNATIDVDETENRINRFYKPYHDRIDRLVNECMACGVTPAIFSIHSFTDRWKGLERPWHTTVLWDRDPRLARPVIELLRQEENLNVGENVPYSGQLKGDTLYYHGTRRGLAHALIEIRQDLIRSEDGQKNWANRLSRVLSKILDSDELRNQITKVEHYGSCADDCKSETIGI
jgi:predicted N-formylglutamate amidohydrolase